MSLWYWLMFGNPTTTANGDGTFTHVWSANDAPLPFKIREDPLMPKGAMLGYYPVIARKDGKTYETLPPSAVMERERLRMKG